MLLEDSRNKKMLFVCAVFEHSLHFNVKESRYLTKRRIMIFYNNVLAKWLLGNNKQFFMLGGLFFTKDRNLEVWEDMELRIHVRQFWECLSLTLLPALILSLWLSWWWMILALATYHVLYWFERTLHSHSVFDWEATENCGDALYLRKRKSYAWMKWYGRKSLPLSDWDE